MENNQENLNNSDNTLLEDEKSITTDNPNNTININVSPATTEKRLSSTSLYLKNNEEILSTIMKSERLVKDDEKITIQFKAAGNAPILKNNKIRLGGFNRFAALSEFLKNSLKGVIKENESLVK
jgi:hypothetical protein